MLSLTIEEHEPIKRRRPAHPVSYSSKLRLKGQWLTDLGFLPGRKVTLHPVPNGLLILHETKPA